MDKPKRRYEFSLNVGADSMDDLRRAINGILFDFDYNEINERSHHAWSGGPDYGYIYDIEFRSDVTHESYFESIDTYLDAQKDNQDGETSSEAHWIGGNE